MYRWRQWDVEIISALMILLAGLMLWSASGCDTAKRVGGEVGGTAAEWIACPTDLIDCGHVYQCASAADTPSGFVEICVNDDDAPEDLDAVEAMYGACELTPRHQGLCLFCCGPDCGRGGNAYNGTYCP